MGTVASFTLRDLNRRPASLFDAVRRFGSAEVRTRSGEVFTVVPKRTPRSRRRAKGYPDFESLWKRQRELGHHPPPASENDRIDRIIAGEE